MRSVPVTVRMQLPKHRDFCRCLPDCKLPVTIPDYYQVEPFSRAPTAVYLCASSSSGLTHSQRGIPSTYCYPPWLTPHDHGGPPKPPRISPDGDRVKLWGSASDAGKNLWGIAVLTIRRVGKTALATAG